MAFITSHLRHLESVRRGRCQIALQLGLLAMALSPALPPALPRHAVRAEAGLAAETAVAGHLNLNWAVQG